VTVDLDVLVRSDLLDFLTQESKDRGATIIYATHIFDGLDEFPTHIAHMRDGSFVIPPVPWPFSGGAGTGLGSGSRLYTIALAWLKEDQEVRRAAEKAGMVPKTRGSRAQLLPCDSETFYKKYDYSH